MISAITRRCDPCWQLGGNHALNHRNATWLEHGVRWCNNVIDDFPFIHCIYTLHECQMHRYISPISRTMRRRQRTHGDLIITHCTCSHFSHTTRVQKYEHVQIVQWVIMKSPWAGHMQGSPPHNCIADLKILCPRIQLFSWCVNIIRGVYQILLRARGAWIIILWGGAKQGRRHGFVGGEFIFFERSKEFFFWPPHFLPRWGGQFYWHPTFCQARS